MGLRVYGNNHTAPFYLYVPLNDYVYETWDCCVSTYICFSLNDTVLLPPLSPFPLSHGLWNCNKAQCCWAMWWGVLCMTGCGSSTSVPCLQRACMLCIWKYQDFELQLIKTYINWLYDVMKNDVANCHPLSWKQWLHSSCVLRRSMVEVVVGLLLCVVVWGWLFSATKMPVFQQQCDSTETSLLWSLASC